MRRSGIARGMKELRRTTGLRAGKGPSRVTPLAAVNVARGRKRDAEKRRKYARFRKSPGRRAAIERAGGRCEMLLADGTRCPMTEQITVHHKTYSRFGGDELPTDLVVLCKPHHDAYEQTHRGYRAAQRARLA